MNIQCTIDIQFIENSYTLYNSYTMYNSYTIYNSQRIRIQYTNHIQLIYNS